MKLMFDAIGLLEIVENDVYNWTITTACFGTNNTIDGAALLTSDDNLIHIVVMPVYISKQTINISVTVYDNGEVRSINTQEPTGQHLGRYEEVINNSIRDGIFNLV